MQVLIDNHIIRRLYFILFALSGFAGLIYESIWTHYLKLFLGHAAYAQTLVLIIFMGGMALGAWLASRYSLRIGNLLLGYAIVEGIIGLLALSFHSVFVHVTDFAYLTVIPQLTSTTLVSLFKWCLAALLILPQAILLGTTFPLMSAGIIRRFPEMLGHSLAILYFANSLGAAIGVLVSGFFLIKVVGLPGTMLTAGLINLLVALIVWLFCHNDSPVTRLDQMKSSSAQQPLSQPLVLALLFCAALTGSASFLYEIGWIRMLSLVLSSSTHAFELMLSAFIFGLAIGGYWIRRHIDNLSSPIKTLGLIQIIMGLLALSTLISYGQSFDWMSYILAALDKTTQGYTLFNVFSHGIALAIMLPATICAGMTLPLLTYYLIAKGYGEESIGKIYAANTLGAIIGIICGVQFIMPTLGVKNLITIGGGLDILLGAILLWYAGSHFNKIRWVVTVGVSGVILLASLMWVKLDQLKMASGVYRYGKVPSHQEVLFHQDGKTASVDLIRSSAGTLTISTNGKPDAAIGKDEPSGDEPTMILLAALPCSIHNQAKTAAVIGFGSGMTSHMLLSIPSLERVDTIEIEPAMIKGAKGFGERIANVFTDPRSHIYIEDAKAYFTNHQQQYDLIISEPSNPWVSGVASLFSQEFYQLIHPYLKETGLLVQWFHTYEINIDLMVSVLKAISNHFADYVIYFPSQGDVIIIASKQGSVNEPTQHIFKIPEMAAKLAYIGINNQQDLLLHRLGNKVVLEPLFNSYPIAANSDYFPILELDAARTRYLNSNVNELFDLHFAAVPLIAILENQPIRTKSITQDGNLYLIAGEKAGQARAIYQYFQYLKSGQRSSILPEMESEIVALVRNVRSLHQQSDHPSQSEWFHLEIEKGWLPYLHILAQKILPYLSASELEFIWTDIESAPSFAKLPSLVQQWFNLYKAVGNRHFQQMLQLSHDLLPKTNPIPASAENNNLLIIAMLAHIALQDSSGAMALFERYTRRAHPPIELRLLAAIASQA